MDAIFLIVERQFPLAYLHDIVIFYKPPQLHIHHVRMVSTLLRNADVSLKLKESSFYFETNDYPGHDIRLRRPEIASRTPEAISKVKEQTKVTELRSFFEFCNVFRRFAPNLASLAALLNAKPQKDQPATCEFFKKTG